ncbi:MAG: tetratricopeptide repeat protein [Planctomycetes bacterium]|nr:tetratricopeptide repeat protein [Planctomycetota bacterium]
MEFSFVEKTEEYLQRKEELRKATEQHRKGTAEFLLSRSEVAAKLDKFFWKACTELLEKKLASAPPALEFTDMERFLLDMGFLDLEIIYGGSQRMLATLRSEFQQPGRDQDVYFSEFLANQYAEYLVVNQSEEPAAKGEASFTKKIEDAIGTAAAGLKKVQRDRIVLLPRLKPLLSNLPGVPPKVVDLVSSGSLDEKIDGLLLRYLGGALDEAGKTQLQQFAQLKTRLMTQLKETMKEKGQQVLVEAIGRLDAKVKTEMQSIASELKSSGLLASGSSAGADEGPLSAKARTKYILAEMRLIRNLVKIVKGDVSSRKTHSALIGDEERITRPKIKEIMNLVRQVDPFFPGDPIALITPYVGTGMFEWDRNSLLIPLTPDRSSEESVLNAVANYRVIMDNLSGGGKLRENYTTVISSSYYRETFIRDYKKWVTGIGRGYRGALENKSYDFFKKFIGPPTAGPLGPVDILNLQPDKLANALRETRVALRTAEKNAELHFRLGTIYWMRGNRSEAYNSYSEAVALRPTNAEYLYALGVLGKGLGSDQTKRCLTLCAEKGAKTIWRVYAQDMLGTK